MRLLALLWAFVFGCCVWAALAADTRPIKMRVSPRVAMEPANLNVQILLVPMASDRILDVVATSLEGSENRSAFSLEGEQSRTFYAIDWKNLSAGHYAVIAAVGNRSATRYMTSERVEVFPR